MTSRRSLINYCCIPPRQHVTSSRSFKLTGQLNIKSHHKQQKHTWLYLAFFLGHLPKLYGRAKWQKWTCGILHLIINNSLCAERNEARKYYLFFKATILHKLVFNCRNCVQCGSLVSGKNITQKPTSSGL
jgi:hypothetical protein